MYSYSDVIAIYLSAPTAVLDIADGALEKLSTDWTAWFVPSPFYRWS